MPIPAVEMYKEKVNNVTEFFIQYFNHNENKHESSKLSEIFSKLNQQLIGGYEKIHQNHLKRYLNIELKPNVTYYETLLNKLTELETAIKFKSNPHDLANLIETILKKSNSQNCNLLIPICAAISAATMSLPFGFVLNGISVLGASVITSVPLALAAYMAKSFSFENTQQLLEMSLAALPGIALLGTAVGTLFTGYITGECVYYETQNYLAKKEISSQLNSLFVPRNYSSVFFKEAPTIKQEVETPVNQQEGLNIKLAASH